MAQMNWLQESNGRLLPAALVLLLLASLQLFGVGVVHVGHLQVIDSSNKFALIQIDFSLCQMIQREQSLVAGLLNRL